MKKLVILIICALVTAVAGAQVYINVDVNQRGPKISPTHYGIFFEDINHAADGGIYAELIRNRYTILDLAQDAGRLNDIAHELDTIW